jgi:tripartite-type tricarboxylate transporter receptor subunit TctC
MTFISRGGLLKISVLILLLIVFSVGFWGCTPAEKPAAEPETSPSGETVEEEEGKWPNKPVTIIVPLDAGGSVDMMCRGIASHLGKYLGVPVAIENIGGGLSIPGITEFLKNRPDDGYTLLAAWQTVLSSRYIFYDADYTLDDFAFLNAHQNDPASVITSKDAPWDTLEELIEDIRERPGEISVGVMHASAGHVAILDLMEMLGLEVRYVSYDSGSEFRLAVAGGHVDVGAGHAAGDHAIGHQLKMLAVYTEEPFELWPDVPPINEALKPLGLEVRANIGSVRMLATHKSFKEKYPERWDILLEAYRNMLDDEGYKAYLEKTGEAPVTAWWGPEETMRINQWMDESIKRYKDLIAGM